MVNVDIGAIRKMQETIRETCYSLEDLSGKIALMRGTARNWQDEQEKHFSSILCHLEKLIDSPIDELRSVNKDLETYALLTEQYNKIDWRYLDK